MNASAKRLLSNAFAIAEPSTSSETKKRFRGKYADNESEEKKHVNQEIIAKTLGESFEGLVIVLDAYHLRTTRALLERGVAASRVHVVERDWSTYEVQAAHALGVRVHCCELFAFLDNCVRSRTPVHALVADLMQPTLSGGELNTLTALARHCQLTHLFVTLSGRDNTGNSLKQRLAVMDEHPLASALPALECVYGYQRGASATSMFLVHRSTAPVSVRTLYRVRAIRELRGQHALVQWHGYPLRGDWTWERASETLDVRA